MRNIDELLSEFKYLRTIRWSKWWIINGKMSSLLLVIGFSWSSSHITKNQSCIGPRRSCWIVSLVLLRMKQGLDKSCTILSFSKSLRFTLFSCVSIKEKSWWRWDCVSGDATITRRWTYVFGTGEGVVATSDTTKLKGVYRDLSSVVLFTSIGSNLGRSEATFCEIFKVSSEPWGQGSFRTWWYW